MTGAIGNWGLTEDEKKLIHGHPPGHKPGEVTNAVGIG